MDPDLERGQVLVELIQGMLEIIATMFRLEFSTPVHDIARAVVRELKKKG